MKEKEKEIKKVTILSLLSNIFLFIIKIIVGLFSNSQSMIADAINSGSDIINSILSYIGNKISLTPEDSDHNLGHGKAEYFYALLVSIIMLLLGINQIKESIKSIFIINNYHFSMWLIIVCLVTIMIKLILYLVTIRQSKKHHNILLEASAIDNRNDMFLTTITLLSTIGIYYRINYIDAIGGIVISVFIIIQAISIYKESYDVLMDKTCPESVRKEVFDIINRHKEIEKVNHFNATPVGYRYQISFSIFVDGKLSTIDSHDIANKLEKEIVKEIEEIYLAVIHVNPI